MLFQLFQGAARVLKKGVKVLGVFGFTSDKTLTELFLLVPGYLLLDLPL